MSGAAPSSFHLPAPTSGSVDVLIIAGEHSGDEHAARLVSEMHAKQPRLTVAALGGPKLAAAGAQLLYDLTASSVVGIVEVLRNYTFFRALFEETLRWIAAHRPRAVCFVDYPGLNLRIAAALRERGLSVKGGGKIKTLFYISPQIWAWKAGRRFAMARELDALAVIFPFEIGCYADTSLPVAFVGHPLVASGHAPAVCSDPAGPVLLLPGSRRQAVARIFPVLLAGFEEMTRTRPELRAVVLYPSDAILDVLRAAHPPSSVTLVPLRALERGLSAGTAQPASAVLTSSGTMSLQCALAGIPGAIAYRANPLTYVLGRMLVKIEYLGMANLLLGEPMYPEYIQAQATSTALTRELEACLANPTRRARTTEQAARLRALLSEPATGTAADWVLRQLGD